VGLTREALPHDGGFGKFKLAGDLRERLDKDLCARLDEDRQRRLRRSLKETVLKFHVTWTPALANKARRRAQELDEPEPEPVAWFFEQEQELRAAGRGDLTEAVRGFEETGDPTLARKARQLARLLDEPGPQSIPRFFKQEQRLRKKALGAVRKSGLREALLDFETTVDPSLAREIRKLARLLGEKEPEPPALEEEGDTLLTGCWGIDGEERGPAWRRLREGSRRWLQAGVSPSSTARASSRSASSHCAIGHANWWRR
jgi:hypothetical protein